MPVKNLMTDAEDDSFNKASPVNIVNLQRFRTRKNDIVYALQSEEQN